MKALTIKQPYAALIINKYKMYEFRSWKTNYRGKILIHAGKSSDKEAIDKFREFNLNYDYGCIIGEADLVDCIYIDGELQKQLSSISEEVYGNNHVGMYAWVLDNIVMYDNDDKVYLNGKLGLWNTK